MGLKYALEELYATGWTALDSQGCTADDTGRLFPTVDRVIREFTAEGLSLSIAHVQLFDCYKAEWTATGIDELAGSVVAHSQEEAAVFALARFRKAAASLINQPAAARA